MATQSILHGNHRPNAALTSHQGCDVGGDLGILDLDRFSHAGQADTVASCPACGCGSRSGGSTAGFDHAPAGCLFGRWVEPCCQGPRCHGRSNSRGIRNPCATGAAGARPASGSSRGGAASRSQPRHRIGFAGPARYRPQVGSAGDRSPDGTWAIWENRRPSAGERHRSKEVRPASSSRARHQYPITSST